MNNIVWIHYTHQVLIWTRSWINYQKCDTVISKNELILSSKTKQNIYSEIYVPKKYGLKHNNTYVMIIYQSSLQDCFKKLFGLNCYQNDDFIQYQLF